MTDSFALLMILAIFVVYFLPSLVALIRGCKSSGAGIIVLNGLLGWTVLGWIIALVWACSASTLADEKRKTEELADALARSRR